MTVKAKPGAAHTKEARVVDIAEGKQAVEISVAAAPEDGKANKAICQVIAKALGLKTVSLSVKTGQASRLKLIEIEGDPAALQKKINAWLGKP